MARKPVNQTRPLETRQAVWNAIRRFAEEGRPFFTVPELAAETLLGRETVRDYARGLLAAGYLAPSEDQCAVTPASMRLVLARDVGAEAPRVRKDGTPVTQGRGRENMWAAMRILQAFTARELSVAATMPDCLVKESSALDYIKHLTRAGYLRRQGDRWRMLPGAYTGPLAPMVQRVKRVYDPNLREVRWTGDNEEAEHDE